MTKAKRIILLVSDISILVAALVALLMFVLIDTKQGQFPISLSREEITAAPPETLRARMLSTAENNSILRELLLDLRGPYLFCGIVALVGGILHLCLTPWRLTRTTK